MPSPDIVDAINVGGLAGQLQSRPGGVSGAGGKITVTTTAGAPTTALKLARGSLCSDTTNGKLYITTDNAGTWVSVGSQT